MFYKEWKTVRLKFYLWAAAYAIFGLLLVTVWSPNRLGSIWRDPPKAAKLLNIPVNAVPYFTPIYYDWLRLSLAITVVAAAMGGMDLVAEEKDKGTLSFLLTRPVTRAQIYQAKIWLNVGALLVAYLPVTLLVFLIDQTDPHPFPMGQAIILTFLIVLIGVLVTCLGGLISIYAHSTIQTLTATAVIIIGSFAGYSYIYERLVPAEILLETAYILVGVLAIGFYGAGLLCFKRKEF